MVQDVAGSNPVGHPNSRSWRRPIADGAARSLVNNFEESFVQTDIKEAGPFERILTIKIDESELESAKNKAARKLSKSMKIKGFRPGKAPRSIVERMVGESAG